MSALVSNDDTDGFDDEDDACPLSGEDLQAARSAMDDPTFIDRLMGTVIYRAKKMGLWSPHVGALVGEHDAIGIAVMCVDKCISGRRRWNRTACPSFYTFCCGQVRSILGNEARKAQRNLVDFVSPIPTTGPEGESIEPPVPATEPGALFAAIATRSGIELGDRFLTDFALALPENSIEQRIIMLVLDDRTCASRARCMELLRIPADQYEAAVKRILRQLRDFTPAWVKTNKISPDDWREAA